MKEFGFNPEASTSTARALILNLVRSAYGPDAAREFMRHMNLPENLAEKLPEAPTQLPLFEMASAMPSDEVPGTLLQKKSRRA